MIYEEYEAIKVVKNAVLILNILVIILCFIGFYIENIYLLYFNMGMLSVLLLLLLLINFIYGHNKKVEKK